MASIVGVIGVTDIKIAKNGAWHSLRGQKVAKGGQWHTFDTGCGIAKDGVWYVLKSPNKAPQGTFVMVGSNNIMYTTDGGQTWT